MFPSLNMSFKLFKLLNFIVSFFFVNRKFNKFNFVLCLIFNTKFNPRTLLKKIVELHLYMCACDFNFKYVLNKFDASEFIITKNLT
jgi:hypothetical protein